MYGAIEPDAGPQPFAVGENPGRANLSGQAARISIGFFFLGPVDVQH
jgi:hypothetical protein